MTEVTLYTVEEWAKRVKKTPEEIYLLTSAATPAVKATYKPGSGRVFITESAWKDYQAQQ